MGYTKLQQGYSKLQKFTQVQIIMHIKISKLSFLKVAQVIVKVTCDLTRDKCCVVENIITHII